ncbi:Flp family type IVb pilin [Paraburkholderia phosphatilytica]|uniref:Flp family type IVb pilin n=1 Tax=Paraburkholderia phosphatilytica TaxID=2282883 RepID=UPI000E4EC4AF|nr:Flp family type IVb pilin [Paraburkholderia phosphatilytica]
MRAFITSICFDERGISAMEYALMAGFVAVALTGIGVAFGTNVSSLFATMWTHIFASAS